MEIASVLGAPQLVNAYCLPEPFQDLAPKQQLAYWKPHLTVELPSNPPQYVKELVKTVEEKCQATHEGGSLVVLGPLTRECRAVLTALLTVLNGALSLVLDGHVVVIGRGRVCVDGGDCLGIVDCDYDLVRWLRRLGLGLSSALLVCGLVLINNPTAGVGDQNVPKESDPKQGK